MDLVARIAQQFTDSAQTKLAALEFMADPIAAAIDAMTHSLMSNGKILACGNGGSAADAQHFAAELLNRFELERPPLAALALTTDSSTLTSIANDYDFSGLLQAGARPRPARRRAAGHLHQRQLAQRDRSRARRPRARDARGGPHRQGGGEIGALLGPDDIHCVPADRTARIQEVHLLTLHCLCDGIDCLLLGVEE
jgi:D-sedoheptulose 7-phosphate isomerase